MSTTNLAERLPEPEIQRQSLFFHDKLVDILLGAVSDSVVIVNVCRQIVYANSAILESMELAGLEEILGMKPGELFGCAHVLEAPGGCGTSKFCRQCGAFRAISKGLDGIGHVDECRILRHEGLDLEAADLRVRATPFSAHAEKFVIIAFHDISDEKRRRALERIFFHDILNTAGGLRGFVEMLMIDAPEHLREDTALLYRFFNTLLEEIKAHKTIMAAESDELAVTPQSVETQPMLESLSAMFREHDVARGNTIAIDPAALDFSFESDISLLHRVLANLLKNALEASTEGQTVTLGCSKNRGRAVFTVHNPGVMDDATQLQIFNRSFSTKGEGRGLGTYSVKLLAERYLQGKVGFSSSEGHGTTFFVELPLELK